MNYTSIRNLFYVVLLLLVGASSYGQTDNIIGKNIRSTVSFVPPRFVSTEAATAAGAAKSGAVIITFGDGEKMWMRDMANTIWIQIGAGGGATVNASNGLTKISDNIYLGGDLTYYTTIGVSSEFPLTIASEVANNGSMGFNLSGSFATISRNTGGGSALEFTINDGQGINIANAGTEASFYIANSGNAYGQVVNTTLNAGLWAVTTNGTYGSIIAETLGGSGTVAAPGMTVRRGGASTSIGDNIGTSLDFEVATDGGGVQYSNKIFSRFTTAATLTRSSQLSIWGVDNAIGSELLTLNGDGELRLTKYGINSFAGSPAYSLGVDASGNLVEYTPTVGVVSETDPLSIHKTGTTALTGDVTIANNTIKMSGSRLQEAMGSTVAAANNLGIGSGNAFIITGNTQINTLSATSWQAGASVSLLFTGSPVIKHNGTGTGAKILLAGDLDLSAGNGDVLTLLFDGTDWNETTRKVAGPGGSRGTVTGVSVVTANGLAGTVANASTAPNITLSTTITGILKGNGTAISAAVSGTDIKTVGGISVIGSGNIPFPSETDPIYSASTWFSTTNNSTDWNTAYTNRISSLTTTGSGAATLIANVLNIPTPVVGTTETASNGLNKLVNDIRLGGTLTMNTDIDLATYYLQVKQSASRYLMVANEYTETLQTNSSNASQWAFMGANATGVNAAVELSASNTGIRGTFTVAAFNSAPDATFNFTSYSSINQTEFRASNKNAMQTGITFSGIQSEYLISMFQDVVDPPAIPVFKLTSTGSARLHKYGVNTFAGTATYLLGVDASGNVVETSAAGGGTTETASQGLTKVVNDIRLGGTLNTNATINASTFYLDISGSSNSPTFSATNTGTGYALQSVSTNASSSAGSFFAYNTSTTKPTAVFANNNSSANTITPILELNRSTTGTAAAGIGSSLNYWIELDAGSTAISNQLTSSWTNPANASRVSEFTIAGVNNATTSTLLTLSGNGSLKLNKYGVNTFAGTAAYALGVDASGNVVEFTAAGGGTTETASNGLTKVVNDIKLGGTLTGSTTITGTSSNIFTISTSVNNGIILESSGGPGLYAKSTALNYEAVYAESNSSITNYPAPGLTVRHSTTGTAANGIGTLINMGASTVSSVSPSISNTLTSIWSNAVTASRTSQFIIGGVNATVLADLFTLSGNGSLKLNKYGINTFTGTAAYMLGVDASGNVVETAGGGGTQHIFYDAAVRSFYSTNSITAANGGPSVNMRNIAIGDSSLRNNTTNGIHNLSLGFSALQTNTTGSYNVAMGTQALQLNTTSSNSVAVGYQALKNSLNMSNTAIGYQALTANTGTALANGYNTAVGFQALLANTTGQYNTAVGARALSASATQSFNVAIGSTAMNNHTGGGNVAIGYNTYTNGSGISNVGIGVNNAPNNTTGSGNVSVGHSALQGLTSGTGNTVSGTNAATTLSTGQFNTVMGQNAMYYSTAGSNNTALGWSSMNNSQGASNTAVGFNSSYYNTTGTWNTALGTQAGDWWLTNNYSVAVGGLSARYAEGDYNTNIGYGTGTYFNEDVSGLKSFNQSDILTSTTVTITAHGFGSAGTRRLLKFTEGTGYVGLVTGDVVPVNIIDANTVQILRLSLFTGSSSTGHSFTPQFIYTNSMNLGYQAANTKSNQIVLGNASVTELLTAAKPKLTAYGAGSVTGTATYGAAFDASGNLIEVALGGGGGDLNIGNGTATTLTIGTLGYTPANPFVTLQSSVNSYNQLIIRNTNTGSAASSDIVVNNDQSTDATFYGDFGMNSSGWAGSGAFNTASNVYLTATSSDLAIGTTTANAVHFVVNNGATDALTISSAGDITMGSNAAILKTPEIIRQTATYTLSNVSTSQKLFNSTTNGSLTIAGSRLYEFECYILLTAMSASSGNTGFSFLGAGTAVVTNIQYSVIGLDNTAPTTAAAMGGASSSTAQSAGNIVTAATGTAMWAKIKGTFQCTTGGTIIPSVNLTTAAAAVVGIGTYFMVKPIGVNTLQATSGWN